MLSAYIFSDITYLYYANFILVEFNFRKFYDGPHKYDKVILLVRDPFDTLLAEWNRQNSGESHIGIAPIKSFSNKKKWKKYVAEQLKLWQNFYTYYVDEYRLDQLHILRYEKLKLNLGLEMKKVLNFLGLDFDKNVEFCVMQKQKGSFKRPKSSINYKQFFTKAQNDTIEASKQIVYSRLGLTELTEQIENKEN